MQRDAERDAEARVHEKQRREIAADAVRSLPQRLGRDVDPPRADEADQPLAQVLPVEEHEDGEHNHRERRADRLHERTHPLGERGKRARRRLGHRQRRRRSGRASLSSSLIASAALPRAPSSGARNARLLADVLAVLGQLRGERKRLARGDVADAADQRAGDRDGDECRRDAPQPPVLEAAYHRREQERSEDGERERDEHVAREVQDRRGDQQPGERRGLTG